MQAANTDADTNTAAAQQPAAKREHKANPQHPHHHYTIAQWEALVLAAILALNQHGYDGGVPAGMHPDQNFPHDYINTQEAVRQLQHIVQMGMLQGLHEPDTWLDPHNAGGAIKYWFT